MYKKNINQIQNYLIKQNIDAYILFLSDDHGSEYINDAYKSIAFICGFTGSAGTLLITKTSSYLWTDGRYFLQASTQLKASDTILMKIGIDISIIDFIKENVNSLAFDFKVASVSFINSLLKVKPNLFLIDESNLLDDIWVNRPKIHNKKVFLLPNKVCLHSANKKCEKTIKYIKSKKKFSVLISALDDIAYLLNARGKDIVHNPVFISFLLLSKVDNKLTYTLFINNKKLTKEVKEKFISEGLIIKPYEHVYKYISQIDHCIYFDSSKTNYKLYSLMKNKKDMMLYPTIAKAIKNHLEIKETKKAHIKDGIAMCKFLYYLNQNVKKNKLSEISIANYLEKLRRKQGAFDVSFNTICGYKEHGAIVHYSANVSTNKKVYNDGLLLVDSGGQYYFGTTDITRTIALGNITDQMKYHFTLVLKAHIAFSMATFDYNTLDSSLDYITRKPLWDNNLDYNHGTGHGIGFMLNVHEGPQSIRYNKVSPYVMKKGMITSNEPGLYIENEYGIRHENEILCVKKEDKLGFEPITYVPFDNKAIDRSLLTDKEINWLNNYHKMVYQKINKYLNEKEKEYLKELTKEI